MPAIKTQMRLAQLTGSLPAFKPVAFAAGGPAANPLTAMAAQDMDGVLKYFAQSISNIHGNLEYGDQPAGLIKAADGSNYDIHLHQQDAGQKIAVESAGTLEVDSAGLMEFESSAGSIVMGGTIADGQTLKIGKTGTVAMVFTPSGTASLEKFSLINTAGDAADAIKIDAVAGGLDLDAQTTVAITGNAFSMAGTDSSIIQVTSSEAAEDLVIQQIGANDSGILVTAAGTGADAVKLAASAGGIDVQAATSLSLDAAGAVNLDSSAGSIVVGSNLADEQTLKLGSTGTVQMTFTPSATPANEKWSLINTAGTAADAIVIDSVAGGLDIDGGTVVNIDAGTDLSLDAAGAVNLDSSAGSIIVGSTLADEQTLKLGKAAAVQMVLTPSATPANEKFSLINTAGTAADAIVIDSVAGGLDIDAGSAIAMNAATTMVLGAADDSSYTVAAEAKSLTLQASGGGAQKVSLLSAGTGVDAIHLNASAGGVSINVVDGQTVALGKGGGVEVLLSPSNVATAEKASLINTSGTHEAAVKFAASAGGMQLSGSTYLGLSGSSVCFSSDGVMDPGLGGSMGFAKYSEFETFRAKTIFSATTTVVGALNQLANSVASSEPTLFEEELAANINQGADVTLVKVAGDAASFAPSIGDNKAQCFVNGQLMRSSSGGVTNDYLIKAGTTNVLVFQFDLKKDDVLQLMDFS